MSNPYSETYFKTLNYSNYLERKDRYRKSAKELEDLLVKLCLLRKEDVILDYGCALGYMMLGFRDLGYDKIWGYDISPWATQVSRSAGNNMLDSFMGFQSDMLIAMDVFEHMLDADIQLVLGEVKSNVLVARIPCSTDGGKSFHLEVSRNDPTHVNCKDKSQWIDLFKQYYTSVLRINLISIYDSPGVACLLAIK
jgi:cyclopropane fatty-acyl-phospholipid synthase-like methyltransferase